MNVRITSELTGNVCTQIQNMRNQDTRLNLGSCEYEKLFVIEGNDEDLTNLVWGKYIDLRKQMPKEWMTDLKNSYRPYLIMEITRSTKEESKTSEEPETDNIRIHLKSGASFLLPPSHTSGHEYKINEDKLSGKLKELFDKYQQYQELHAKWAKISQDILTYLRSAKSLNSALKGWVELKAFIPQEYLDRVDAKPERTAERKKAEESLASIDRNLAVTNATLVKLAMS
jgi:hypothetical protein